LAELERHYRLHILSDCANCGALLAEAASSIRALAANGARDRVSNTLSVERITDSPYK
jgi:hypothetical protein